MFRLPLKRTSELFNYQCINHIIIKKKRKHQSLDDVYSDTYLEFFKKKTRSDNVKYLSHNYVQEQETEISIKSFNKESYREDKI